MEVPTLKELEEQAKGAKAPATVAPVAEAPKIIQCKSKKSTLNGGGYGTGKRKKTLERD